MQNYTSYYQRIYRQDHKEKIKQQKSQLYFLYKPEYIPCIFCSRIVQLNGCSRHLKSKGCKEIQDEMPNKTELMIEFKKQLNQTKASLRLGLEDTESQDETLSVG